MYNKSVENSRLRDKLDYFLFYRWGKDEPIY